MRASRVERRSRLALVAAGTAIVACVLVAQGIPPAGQAARTPGVPQASEQAGPKTPAAIIRGRVTSAASGAALRRARVVLNAGAPDARVTSTDQEGRYEFKALAAARYTVTASKATFVTLQYGQRLSNEPGRPVDVGEEEVAGKIDVALPKAGVIAGTVFDDLGEPAQYVRVGAMRLQYLGGRRQLVTVGSPVRTNDLGQYRISGLPSGSYCVGTPPSVADSVPRPMAGRSFGPSYYPGTSTLAEAIPIVLDVGQERLDADFALVAGRTAKVIGAVVTRGGRPLAGASLCLMQSMGPASALFIAGWATSRADGTFTFENLAAGEYTLYLDGTDGANAGAVTASRQVTVAGKDIDNLIVTALPTLTVTGRVRFEPAGQATPGPAAQKAISVRPESSADSPLSMGVKTTVGADWTFGIRNLSAGPTRFTVAGLPSGWAVEAITFDGRDVTEVPLDVRSDLNGVEIVLTSQLTELTGLVTDGDARPVAECVLIVYPDDPSRWDRSRRLATARPDQSGRFSVRGLPPGDYLVVAVEHVEGDDAHDPDYLERLRRGATKVTLGKGETKSLDLKVVDGTAGS